MEKSAEQLKRFTFFAREEIKEAAENSAVHAKLLANLELTDAVLIFPRLFLLEQKKHSISVFQNNCISYEFEPFNHNVYLIDTNNSDRGGYLFGFGQEKDVQSVSSFVKIWQVKDGERLGAARKKISVGKTGSPLCQGNRRCFSVLKDMTMMAIGTREGPILCYEAKNLLGYEPGKDKHQTFQVEVRQIKCVHLARRSLSEVDVYYSTEDSFHCLRTMREKKKLLAQMAEACDISAKGTAFASAAGEGKTIGEFDQTRCVRSWPLEGQKQVLKCFKGNYVASLTLLRKDKQERHVFQILDMENVYVSHYDEKERIEWVGACSEGVLLLINTPERRLIRLTERDNAYKIETFFKKKYYNEAYRFAQNQNNGAELLAEISKLHGDHLYEKGDFAGAVKQYVLTIGHCEPSYIIRKFLDVTQVEFLISYLESLHARKKADKEHTALLLNCYVKQRKIEELSRFLEESTFDSNLFDVETAIKVCRDLEHKDLALRLAQQKRHHQLFLRILIEDKQDCRRALEHIRLKVPLELKERYLIEFGQELMQAQPMQTLDIIKNLANLNSLAIQLKQTPDRRTDLADRLSEADVRVLEQLGMRRDEVDSITTVIFRRSDEYLRLFMKNRVLLKDYLEYLLKLDKVASEGSILHRLFQLYLEQLKEMVENYEDQLNVEQLEGKIMELLRGSKKYDRMHLLFLFKIHNFDKGTVFLYDQLEMREELMHFLLEKARENAMDSSLKERQKAIIQLCVDHGSAHSNLWIQAIKYFANPENRGVDELPFILSKVASCGGLSPLLVLRLLAKHKNVSFGQVKEYFLNKVKLENQLIQENRYTLESNQRRIAESKETLRKLKTSAKIFQAGRCSKCEEEMSLPSLHFMCGHSYHEHCLGGERSCPKCSFQMSKKIIERKQTFEKEAKNQKRLFEALEEKQSNSFNTICEFMGKGLFSKQILLRN